MKKYTFFTKKLFPDEKFIHKIVSLINWQLIIDLLINFYTSMSTVSAITIFINQQFLISLTNY
jgi:hypothetical protein